jgi:hypothetical protein
MRNYGRWNMQNGMHIETMEFLWKDSTSGGGGCPSISRANVSEEKGYVVVGKKLDADTSARVPQVADDEIAIFVPANVLDRLKDLG